MLGNTHLAVGVAASLALAQPTDTAECFIAVMSGAVGSIVCDVDAIRGSRGSGAMQAQLFAGTLIIGVLILDAILQTGICSGITAADTSAVLSGLFLFASLWVFGYFAAHRSFTHSLAAMILFTFAVYLIHPPLVPGFLAAYTSHLALDTLNKRPIRLFYPLGSGVCLGLFYAKSRANSLFLHAGNLISAFFILRLILA